MHDIEISTDTDIRYLQVQYLPIPIPIPIYITLCQGFPKWVPWHHRVPSLMPVQGCLRIYNIHQYLLCTCITQILYAQYNTSFALYFMRSFSIYTNSLHQKYPTDKLTTSYNTVIMAFSYRRILSDVIFYIGRYRYGIFWPISGLTDMLPIISCITSSLSL